MYSEQVVYCTQFVYHNEIFESAGYVIKLYYQVTTVGNVPM